MYSFAIHDIGEDTPHTNWENPVTVRDKIRVAFKENNCEYYIRDTIFYPAAHDIVKPLKEGVGELVEWWKDPEREGEGEGGEGELDREGEEEEGGSEESSDVSGEEDEEMEDEETKKKQWHFFKRSYYYSEY